MITPAIVSYVETERAKKTPDSVIKSNLLANGWSDVDITESMSSIISPSVSKPFVINDTDLKKYRNKMLWTTFAILVVLDVALILILGGRGLFGISPLSMVARILVIYLVSAFAVRGFSPKPGQSTLIAAGNSVVRIMGALFMALLIGVGIFFALCLRSSP